MNDDSLRYCCLTIRVLRGTRINCDHERVNGNNTGASGSVTRNVDQSEGVKNSWVEIRLLIENLKKSSEAQEMLIIKKDFYSRVFGGRRIMRCIDIVNFAGAFCIAVHTGLVCGIRGLLEAEVVNGNCIG